MEILLYYSFILLLPKIYTNNTTGHPATIGAAQPKHNK